MSAVVTIERTKLGQYTNRTKNTSLLRNFAAVRAHVFLAVNPLFGLFYIQNQSNHL